VSTSLPPAFTVSIAQPGPPGPPGAQSPWLSDIDAGEFNLTNLMTLSFVAAGSNITAQAGGVLVFNASFISSYSDALTLYNSGGRGRLYMNTNGQFTLYPTDDATPPLIVEGAGIQFPDGSVQTSAALNTVGASQTPWVQDIDAAGHDLLNGNNIQALSINSRSSDFGIQTQYTNRLTVDTAGHVTVLAPDDSSPALVVQGTGMQVQGDVNVTGAYRRNGVSLAITNQTDVSGSRAAGVVYQNTTGKTIFVSCCWNLQAKSSSINVYTDASNPPTSLVAQMSDPSNSSGITTQIFFMVLTGHYYECVVTQGAPTIVSWIEYD